MVSGDIISRNLVTELVIRLLAIWLFFRSAASLFLSLNYTIGSGLPLLINIALFIVATGIAFLIIYFAERISKLIWMDKKLQMS